MGKHVYLTNVSLDLLIEDEHGSLDWRAPSDELFVHPTTSSARSGPTSTAATQRDHVPVGDVADSRPSWPPSPTHLTAEFAGIWAAATRETSR